MALPPNRLDDLRALALALGPEPPSTPSGRPPRGPRAWPFVLVLGVVALAWTAVRTCGFRGCEAAPPEVAVRVALALATPHPTSDAEDGPAGPNDAPDGATDAGARVRAWDRVPATPRAEGRVLARVPATPVARTREAVPKLAGRWLVTNTIETTSRGSFRGLRMRFRVVLEQRGTRLTGRGTKFTVNDQPVSRAERVPIDLEGEIRGRDVVVRFVERGRRRSTRGAFRWHLSPDGTRLQGRFESTAAASSGTSSARRDG